MSRDYGVGAHYPAVRLCLTKPTFQSFDHCGLLKTSRAEAPPQVKKIESAESATVCKQRRRVLALRRRKSILSLPKTRLGKIRSFPPRMTKIWTPRRIGVMPAREQQHNAESGEADRASGSASPSPSFSSASSSSSPGAARPAASRHTISDHFHNESAKGNIGYAVTLRGL